jgi:hypothetical protein
MRRRIAALAGLCLLLTAAPVQASAITFHVHVPYVAEFRASTCPWEEGAVPDGTICDESYGILFLEYLPQDSQNPHWGFFLSTWKTIVGAFYDYDFANGLVLDPTHTYDTKTFATASVSASVPMDDGSTIAVDLAWDLSNAPLQVSGNTGPYQSGNEIDWHMFDGCATLNTIAHQRYRFGADGMLTGTLGAVDVETLFEGAIGFEPFMAGGSIYTYVTAPHGDCATP